MRETEIDKTIHGDVTNTAANAKDASNYNNLFKDLEENNFLGTGNYGFNWLPQIRKIKFCTHQISTQNNNAIL